MFLGNRFKGRNKIQDVWDKTPHKLITRLDTGNTYVVVPLVASPGEEESRKTVHRNYILHVTKLTNDMGLGNSSSVSHEGNREDICSNDVLTESVELKRRRDKEQGADR